MMSGSNTAGNRKVTRLRLSQALVFCALRLASWQSEHSAALEREEALEAEGKDEAQSFATELEQLRPHG